MRASSLFPVQAIEDAYAKMRAVWESQRAGHKLDARIYDVPHLFDLKMQQDAFEWLDRQLKMGAPERR